MAPPDEDPFLAKLSASQREAVLATQGHLLLLAGAGSGKTRVITHRIARLIAVEKVAPHRILAVTFTNKAAREMLERVGDLLPPPGVAPGQLWIMTFHALGARLLRLNAAAAGLSPGFTIFDEADAERLVKRICARLGIDTTKVPVGGTCAAIGRFKSELVEPSGDDPLLAEVDRLRIRIYHEYQKELAEQDAVDFADLIARPVKLLSSDEALRIHYQSRFQHVLVDEYQDTDRSQYTLMKLLVGPQAALCAVGDEDQSIYGWRGADIRNILDFKSDFPGARVLMLDKNYRCPIVVLEAANAMIRNNASRLKEREVVSEKEGRWPVSLHEVESPESEGELVAQAIAWMRMEEGFGYQDCAVFYRTHVQARAIEQALGRRGIPYKVFGGLRFYERKAIKDLVAYLRLLVNPKDREAFLRIVNVPRRGIGEKGAEKLVNAAMARGVTLLEALGDPKILGGKAGKAGLELRGLMEELAGVAGREPLASLLRHLAVALRYDEYLAADDRAEDWELVDELDAALAGFAAQRPEMPTREALGKFLEEAALVSPTDTLESESGAVSLMTLHNAKGLEFPVVFITGLEEGLLPHENALWEPSELEEERRLFYVGMTRTKSRLFLTRAFTRVVRGGFMPRRASRFLGEIGEERLQLGGA